MATGLAAEKVIFKKLSLFDDLKRQQQHAASKKVFGKFRKE